MVSVARPATGHGGTHASCGYSGRGLLQFPHAGTRARWSQEAGAEGGTRMATAAARVWAIGDIVDLGRYPIAHLAAARARRLVEDCRRELAARGA